MSAAVVCTPEDATGDQGSAVPINNANKPGNAILTLGESGGENGFTFKTNGSGAAFRVRGGVWSNSNIFRDNNGNLESTESIRAHTGCTPVAAMVAPIVNCSASTAPDPNYQSDLDIAGTGIPALRTPPASCPNNGTVTLQPGYYDDVDKLNALTDTNTNCFIHLTPGSYYFDFHNNSGTTSGVLNDPLFDADIASGSDNVWMIGGRKTLVAGTLTSDTTVPGRCVSPIDDVNANGVQLIFGGDSRMQHQRQRPGLGRRDLRELPRQPAADRGLRAEDRVVADGDRRWSGRRTAPPTAAPRSTSTGRQHRHLHRRDHGQPAAPRTASRHTERQPGGLDAATDTGTNSARRGTITMTGFAPTTSAPGGHGAHRRAARRSPTDRRATQNKVTFSPEPRPGHGRVHAAGPDQPRAPRTSTSPSGPGGAPSRRRVHDQGFTGAHRCRSSAERSNKTQISQLDAVRLELTYYVPQLRGQTTAAITGNTVATVGGAPGHPGAGQLDDALHPGHDATPRCRRSTCRSTTSTSRSSGSG